MTIANTFAAKLSVAFVAIAMALTMIAPAQAQTAEELQAQIDSLLATITALQAQLGVAVTPAASANAYVFTRSLTIGAQGADVTALQTYLIAAGFTIPAGATGYFGTQTQAAVAAWQGANGVTPPAGYFGPISQARYAQLTTTVVVPPTGTGTGTGTGTSTGSTVTLSGSASFNDADLKDGDDTDIEEGQSDAPVADFTPKFTDGDAMITRLDVALTASGEEKPWKTFDSISLWVDGDMVAEADANSKDDYVGDENDGVIRFSGLNIAAMEGKDVTITIGATVAGSVKNLPATWNVDVTGMRWLDADGVNSTEDNGSIGVNSTNFDISVAGADDEIIVKSSSENPDATTLQLSSTKKTSYTNVFSFDLDTKDSTNDIDVTTIPVTITTVGGNIGSIVNDMKLVIDGQSFSDWSYATGTSASTTAVVLFDINDDLTIDSGDRVTGELQVEFKALASEGSTIKGSITSNNSGAIEAEGADDLNGSGSATGNEQTLRSSGAILEAGTMTVSKDLGGDTVTDDKGIFTLKFDVTAFESDLFIAKTAAVGTSTADGVNYRITNGSGLVLVGAGTTTASLSSSAVTESGYYKVNEGETKTFTLTVTHDPATTGFYGVELYSLNFKSVAGAANVFQRALPASDYETDPLSI